MQVKSILELTLGLDKERFRKIFIKMCGKKNLSKDRYVDHSMASDGITVTYRNSQYKKRITFTVDPDGVLGSDDLHENIPKFIRKLDAAITNYFNSKYTLKDLNLSKMILTTDIDLHDRSKVADYLKVLQRIGKVKGFTVSTSKELEEETYFWLRGNSNGMEFIIYDLETMLRLEARESDTVPKKLKSAIAEADGVLRAEVQLTEARAIRAYANEMKTAKQIADLLKNSQQAFMDVFTRAIPFGGFYKKSKAVEIIRKSECDDKLRRRMLRLIDLIPEKRSLHLAQKALNYRKIDDVMDMFAYLDLSPITIAKRHDVKKLDNLYKYL